MQYSKVFAIFSIAPHPEPKEHGLSRIRIFYCKNEKCHKGILFSGWWVLEKMEVKKPKTHAFKATCICVALENPGTPRRMHTTEWRCCPWTSPPDRGWPWGPAGGNTWCTTACPYSSSDREQDREQEQHSSLTLRFIQQAPLWMTIFNQIRDSHQSSFVIQIIIKPGGVQRATGYEEKLPAFGISRHWSHLEFQIPNKNKIKGAGVGVA